MVISKNATTRMTVQITQIENLTNLHAVDKIGDLSVSYIV